MKWVVLCVLVVGIGILMHMYRYEYIDQSVATVSYVVRIDRLTGQGCFFSGPDGMRQKLLQMPVC